MKGSHSIAPIRLPKPVRSMPSPRKFEDVVKAVEQATVLVLLY